MTNYKISYNYNLNDKLIVRDVNHYQFVNQEGEWFKMKNFGGSQN